MWIIMGLITTVLVLVAASYIAKGLRSGWRFVFGDFKITFWMVFAAALVFLPFYVFHHADQQTKEREKLASIHGGTDRSASSPSWAVDFESFKKKMASRNIRVYLSTEQNRITDPWRDTGAPGNFGHDVKEFLTSTCNDTKQTARQSGNPDAEVGKARIRTWWGHDWNGAISTDTVYTACLYEIPMEKR